MDPALAVEVEALSRFRALQEATARGDSAIQQFYGNSTPFITGGSGFLGKQLVEKLFRACNVNKIYLLLRPKKGKNIRERLQEILADPVYDALKKQKPDFAEKIHCIEGDVAEIKLGINDQEWNMLADEVDIIFHVAATTRFDESFRVATLVNVRGCREALLLGKACKKLRAFVHVSTAYSHCTKSRVEGSILEQWYASPVPPDTCIRLADSVDQGTLDELTPNIINGWPNTYTFAKAVAEEQVRQIAHELPVCIVRPSIVISAHYEPIPGWMDMSCAYSASGFIIGSGLGLMHVIQATPATQVSLVPVDYVNNCILAAGWAEGTRQQRGKRTSGESETKIYNVVMSPANKLYWEKLRTYLTEIGDSLAIPKAVWRTYVVCVQNYHVFLLLTLFLHIIPACLLDAGLLLLGRERKFVGIYKKIYKLSVTLSFFTNNNYHLDDENTTELYKKMSETDKKIFYFDMKAINWFQYSKIWCIGIRKYIIKDGLQGTEVAKRKQFWFKYMNYGVMSLYVFGLFYVLSHFCYLLGRLIN